jgi:hypothetical protein
MQSERRSTLLMLFFASVGAASAQPAKRNDAVRLRLELGSNIMTATLVDNATVRDLVAQLPLELTAKDFASVEKVAYPPKKLTTQGAPAAYTPSAGDLAYYAPWGNLAMFHANGHHSPGLVFMGRFDGQLDALRAPGDVKVRIALLN